MTFHWTFFITLKSVRPINAPHQATDQLCLPNLSRYFCISKNFKCLLEIFYLWLISLNIQIYIYIWLKFDCSFNFLDKFSIILLEHMLKYRFLKHLNSHFRGSRMKNFLRHPTMVGGILQTTESLKFSYWPLHFQKRVGGPDLN